MDSYMIVRRVDIVDTVNQAAGAAQRKGVTTLGAFVASLSLSLMILAVGILTFVLGRNRQWQIYQPRLLHLDASKRLPLPSGLVAGIRKIVSPDVDMVHHSGIDAYLFLRFLGGMAFYFGLATVVACPILIPLNVMANRHEHAQGLNLLKWTGLHTSPAYITCHTIVIILLSGLLCWLISCEYEEALQLRERDLRSTSSKHQQAVVIRCAKPQSQAVWNSLIPQYDHRRSGPRYFAPSYHGRISDARFRTYEARAELEDQIVKLLAQSIPNETTFSRLAGGCDRLRGPTRFWRRCIGRATRNPFTCASDLGAAFRELENVAQQKPTEAETSMVLVFDEPLSATLASLTQVSLPLAEKGPQPSATDTQRSEKESQPSEKESHPSKKESQPSEEDSQRPATILPTCPPSGRQLFRLSALRSLLKGETKDWTLQTLTARFDDIKWGNVANHGRGQYWSVWWTRLTLIGLVIAWTVPIAFSGSLSQFGSLAAYSPLFRGVEKIPPSILSVLQASLPSVLTTGLIALFHPVLRWLVATRCLISGCAEELAVQRYDFFFLWVHLFLNTSIASGVTAALADISANPNATMTILAENLPQASNFFFVYVLLRVFSEVGFVVAQLMPFAAAVFLRRSTATPRRLAERYIHRMKTWGTVVSVHSVLASIVIIYAPLAPLILPIGALAFGLLWIAYQYFFLCVAEGDGNGEGLFYLQTLSHLFVALCTQQVCSIGQLLPTDMSPMSRVRAINIALRVSVLCISLLICQNLHTQAQQRLRTAMFPSEADGNLPSNYKNQATDQTRVTQDELAADAIVLVPNNSQDLGTRFIQYLTDIGLKVEFSTCVKLDDQGKVVLVDPILPTAHSGQVSVS